jgi:hypothetical protein
LTHSDSTSNFSIFLRIFKHHTSLTLFVVSVDYVVGLTSFNLSA